MKIFAVLCCFIALSSATVSVWASPPKLVLPPPSENHNADETRPGAEKVFGVIYQDDSDLPKSVNLVMETPSGQVIVPAHVSGSDPSNIPVTWSYTPQDSGTYRFHFEATSSTGETARLPAALPDYEFLSVSLVTKFIILAVGLVISLLFLPFIVYAATRSINRNGDPAAAARVSLVLGIAASLGLLLCLFVVQGFQYSWLGWALGVLTILAVIVVLTSRRRVA